MWCHRYVAGPRSNPPTSQPARAGGEADRVAVQCLHHRLRVPQSPATHTVKTARRASGTLGRTNGTSAARSATGPATPRTRSAWPARVEDAERKNPAPFSRLNDLWITPSCGCPFEDRTPAQRLYLAPPVIPPASTRLIPACPDLRTPAPGLSRPVQGSVRHGGRPPAAPPERSVRARLLRVGGRAARTSRSGLPGRGQRGSGARPRQDPGHRISMAWQPGNVGGLLHNTADRPSTPIGYYFYPPSVRTGTARAHLFSLVRRPAAQDARALVGATRPADMLGPFSGPGTLAPRG